MLIELHDIIGFSGAFLVLIAYFLLLTKKITSDGLMHSVLNFVGAILILFSLINAWNLTAVIIEIIWGGLALIGIYRWVRHHQTDSRQH